MMGTLKAPGDGADYVTALLSGPLVNVLDRYIREEAPDKTRSGALAIAFQEWCIDRGYINPMILTAI